MRIISTTLVVANIKEAKKGSKKRRPTSTPTETYVKVNQQALQQKINALRETLRLQECSAEKLSDKGTHSKNKRWKSSPNISLATHSVADRLPQELERYCQA